MQPSSFTAPPDDAGLEMARIKAIQDNAQRLGLTWQLRLATVLPNTTGTANSSPVVMDGDTAAIDAVSMIGPLQGGMRVYVITSPPAGNHIVGMADARPTKLGKAVAVDYSLALGSTTSATPVAIPGAPAVSITKYYDDTYLHFVFACTFFSSVAAQSIDIQTGRLDVANGSFNTRQQVAGQASATLPAGPYTFEGYWFRNTGAGTLFVTTDDSWSMSVEEYLP